MRAVASLAAGFALGSMILLSAAVRAEEPDAPAPVPAAPESAGPGFREGSDADQVDLLRKLLGVAEPKLEPATVRPPRPAPPPEKRPAPEPPPTARPASEPAPSVKAPDQADTAPKKSPARPAPAPARPRRAPKPAPPAVHEAATTPSAPAGAEPDTGREAASVAAAEPAVYGRSAHDGSAAVLDVMEKDLPAVGTILNGRNVERWGHILTPSMRWALRRGARMEVVEPRAIAMEPWRIEATEKYHAQVHLSADKKSLVNYTAGVPFPMVTESDPDAALKLIYNFENRIIIDDLEARNFGCETAALDVKNGMEVQRAGRFGSLRRLHYTGRLRLEPTPTWKTSEGIRYRESLFPVLEPFNNKGAGFSYARYLDPARQDDAWLYLPLARRVRRLSTAQRSEGVFGVDIDLDSYGGFAGNPAWFDWKLLGKKTLLEPMRAKNEPVKWCDKPADFMFDDVWEPRDVYILTARSLIPGYNFSLRVVYIDEQSMLIPYTEVYDHAGQLWRAYFQQFKSGVDRPMKYAEKSVYPVDMIFISAVTVFDMQLEHDSRCQFPAPEEVTEEGWYYWYGDKGGTKEADFDVKNFLTAGH